MRGHKAESLEIRGPYAEKAMHEKIMFSPNKFRKQINVAAALSFCV